MTQYYAVVANGNVTHWRGDSTRASVLLTMNGLVLPLGNRKPKNVEIKEFWYEHLRIITSSIYHFESIRSYKLELVSCFHPSLYLYWMSNTVHIYSEFKEVTYEHIINYSRFIFCYRVWHKYCNISSYERCWRIRRNAQEIGDIMDITFTDDSPELTKRKEVCCSVIESILSEIVERLRRSLYD